MDANKYISLQVLGNPYANAGYGAIAWFNNPDIYINKDDYVGFVNNHYFVVIKIEERQVVYTLVRNHVKSFRALREGVSLKISMSVPKGYGFDGGISPYDVLLDLQTEFLDKCMILVDPITNTYEYKDGMTDNKVLDYIAQKYPLVPQMSGRYYVMKSGSDIGYILADNNKTRELLSDVQYPEFSGFSEIVVAQNVTVTSYTPINGLQIPRIITYSIFVDGKLMRKVSGIDENLYFPPNVNQDYYEVGKVPSFSIRQLLDNKQPVMTDEGREYASINRQEEKVDVDTGAVLTKPKSKNVKLKFDLQECEKCKQFFQNNPGAIKITNLQSSKQFKLKNDLSFDLTGEDIAYLSKSSFFKVSLDTPNYSNHATPSIGETNGEYVLSIPIQSVQTVSSSQRSSSGETSSINSKLQVTDNGCAVSIKDFGDCKLEIVQEEDSKIQPVAAFWPSRNPIHISSSLINKKFYFRVTTQKMRYISQSSVYSLISRHKSSPSIQLNSNDFKQGVKITSKTKTLFIIASLIGLVVGIVVGFSVGYIVRPKIDNNQNSEINNTVLDADDGIRDKVKQFEDELKQADQILLSDSLTFQEVENLYNKIIKSDNYSEFKKTNGLIVDKVETYHKLLESLENYNVDIISSLIDNAKLTDCHKNYVQVLIRNMNKDGSSYTNYTRTQKKDIEDQLSKKMVSGSLCRFCDISKMIDLSFLSVDPNKTDTHSTQFKCQHCEKAYKNEKELMQHNTDYQYYCDEHKLCMKTANEYEKHMNECHD